MTMKPLSKRDKLLSDIPLKKFQKRSNPCPNCKAELERLYHIKPQPYYHCLKCGWETVMFGGFLNSPRDKKRIGRICEELQRLWERYPDQRLGQLLENYVFSPSGMFYCEDDNTEKRIIIATSKELPKSEDELSYAFVLPPLKPPKGKAWKRKVKK